MTVRNSCWRGETLFLLWWFLVPSHHCLYLKERWLNKNHHMKNIRSFINGCAVLCWHLTAFFSFWFCTQSVGLLGQGISLSQALCLHSRQNKQNIRKQTSAPREWLQHRIPVFNRRHFMPLTARPLWSAYEEHVASKFLMEGKPSCSVHVGPAETGFNPENKWGFSSRGFSWHCEKDAGSFKDWMLNTFNASFRSTAMGRPRDGGERRTLLCAIRSRGN